MIWPWIEAEFLLDKVALILTTAWADLVVTHCSAEAGKTTIFWMGPLAKVVVANAAVSSRVHLFMIAPWVR